MTNWIARAFAMLIPLAASVVASVAMAEPPEIARNPSYHARPASQRGLNSNPQFTVGDQQAHLNPAGYDAVVTRTLPAVEAAVRRAGGRHR
jgi:hypothetical protein